MQICFNWHILVDIVSVPHVSPLHLAEVRSVLGGPQEASEMRKNRERVGRF